MCSMQSPVTQKVTNTGRGMHEGDLLRIGRNHFIVYGLFLSTFE